jgi:CheY-like chemotaxis protein
MSRILVVEDNPVNMKLVEEILRLGRHDIVGATTVEEARSRLSHGAPPDLVLLDLHIPGGGGERVLNYIRAEPRLAQLPVIAVTAQAMQGDRERILEAGFDGYISKPIQVREFAAEVEAKLAA